MISELPQHLKGKKVVMSAEMYVQEILTLLMAFSELVEKTDFKKLTKNQKERVVLEYAIGYLQQVYENNVENTGATQ